MDKSSVQIGPVSKDLLYIKVADAIFEFAKANHLKAGDKLPSERELAKMFQTGRNSVREAMRVLENRGMIEVKTGLGTFLKEPLNEADSIQLKLVKENFFEIQELKVSLEYMAARKAIRLASEESKKKLLSLAEEMMELYEKNEYSDEVDHRFHMQMMEMAENQTVAQMVDKLRLDVFNSYWEELDYDPENWLKTVPYHLELAKAFQKNDEKKAIEAIEAINQVSQEVLKMVSLKKKNESL